MGILISLIVTILENLNGFLKTDKELIKMAKTFKATKYQILTKIVIPANLSTFINSIIAYLLRKIFQDVLDKEWLLLLHKR